MQSHTLAQGPMQKEKQAAKKYPHEPVRAGVVPQPAPTNPWVKELEVSGEHKSHNSQDQGVAPGDVCVNKECVKYEECSIL